MRPLFPTILSALAWLIATALVLTLFQTGLTSSGVPVSLRIAAALVLGVSAWRPANGLLIFAAIVALTSSAITVLGGPFPRDWSEVFLLAVLGGALIHHAYRPVFVPGSTDLTLPSVVFGAVVAASCLAQLGAASLLFERFGTAVRELAFKYYFIDNMAFRLVVDAAMLIEGVALLCLTEMVCASDARMRERLPGMLVAGAAGAAALNVSYLVSLGLRSGNALPAIGAHLLHSRINVHYGDVNAAGSYFALMMLVALGMAMTRRGARAAWWFATAFLALTLWMTGSRTAVVAAIAVTIIVQLYVARRRWGGPRARYIGLGMAAAGALLIVAVVVFYQRSVTLRLASQSIDVRIGFARAALHMLRDHPVFGVGVGQFYTLSADYLPPLFRAMYYARENAHNNFLQVLAELGTVGLVAFLWVLAAVAFRLRHAASSPMVIAAAAGLVTFLLTCLAGHPLLTREVAYTFWMVMGFAAAHGTPISLPRVSVRAGAAVAVIVLACTVPYRWHQVQRSTDLEHVAFGVSLWTPAYAGPRTRTVGRHATFFVPSDANGTEFQLRSAMPGVEPIVDLWLNGNHANRVIARADWQVARLVFIGRRKDRYFKVDMYVSGPVNLQSTDDRIDAGVVMGWIKPLR